MIHDPVMELKRIKQAISVLHKEYGNERCHVTLHTLFEVAGLEPPSLALPPRDVFLKECELFHHCMTNNEPYVDPSDNKVLVERDECAKIAEFFCGLDPNDIFDHVRTDTAMKIATAIRTATR